MSTDFVASYLHLQKIKNSNIKYETDDFRLQIQF